MSIRQLPSGLWSSAGVDWPAWTPPDLREWLGRLKHSTLPFDPKVVIDPRMKPVWEWHGDAKWLPSTSMTVTAADVFRSSLSFCMTVRDATRMPGKPGNLPPKERAVYLAKVRRHALALMELLEGTRFSACDFGSEVDPEEFTDAVTRALAPWGDDDSGHVVAFWVDEDGTYQMPWDYPDCHLLNHLGALVSWSKEDDLFDRSIMRSSKPIIHAKSRSSRIIYFTCTLFEKMERYGISVPFGHLATIANVALELKGDETLDEDSARKQVRRYQARIGKTPPDLENESDSPF